MLQRIEGGPDRNQELQRPDPDRVLPQYAQLQHYQYGHRDAVHQRTQAGRHGRAAEQRGLWKSQPGGVGLLLSGRLEGTE